MMGAESMTGLTPVNESMSIIQSVNLQTVQAQLNAINQFQTLVHKMLKQNQDFGIIPGTVKPTLLKPGAEKILMLLGLQSSFEIIEQEQDYDDGFFAFTVCCKLIRMGEPITEGLGHCNSREKRYIKTDPYTVANTCLKMAKKRAMVDAALTVASLSDIFTQDIEDMDLEGNAPTTNQTTFDDDRVISESQAKRLYALSKGNADLCKRVIGKYGYSSSKEIKKIDYEKIAAEIEAEAKASQA